MNKDNEINKENLIRESLTEVEDLEVCGEQLSMDILQTREELAVISEVREELVKLYADFKDVEQIKDKTISENEAYVKEIEKLSANLHDYKLAEEKLAAEKQLQKLEKLSAKFSALGQQKTVEQLQAKDEETLSEFERIVDAALQKVGETSEMPSVTRSSQEKLEEAPSKEEKTSNVVAPEPKEQLSDENFFANICNELSSEQLGNTNKRVRQF